MRIQERFLICVGAFDYNKYANKELLMITLNRETINAQLIWFAPTVLSFFTNIAKDSAFLCFDLDFSKHFTVFEA